MSACCYCGKDFKPVDLRPYGPGGTLTCFRCGDAPENKETTKGAFYALLQGSAAIAPNGVVAIGLPDGPIPFDPKDARS